MSVARRANFEDLYAEISQLRQETAALRAQLAQHEDRWRTVIGTPRKTGDTGPLPAQKAEAGPASPRSAKVAVEVWQLIIDYFDDDELANLAFQSGVEYDGLKGETKGARARSLVGHFFRRGLLQEFIELCQAERPNVEWPIVPTK